jgi:hypothetical protein
MATGSRRYSTEPPAPPADAAFVRSRWIPGYRRRWAEECVQIMRAHGAVYGSRVYDNRPLARYHAQALMKLMQELRLAEKWELSEHTEKRGDGWVWAIEWRGTHGDERKAL